MARLNLLTVYPELRWLKGGSFLVFTLSSAALITEKAAQQLPDSSSEFFGRISSTFKDPLTWLILLLMTYTVHVSVTLPNMFVILYLTAYKVTRE
jgi:hypothetical protein